MKKLPTVFVVLMSLVMAGCLVENNSAEIAELKQEIEELKKESTKEEKKESFFEENIKCQKFKDELKKEYESLEAIFYSPKEEACLFTTKYTQYDNPEGRGFMRSQALLNFFTKEEIISVYGDTEEDRELFREFENTLKQYR